MIHFADCGLQIRRIKIQLSVWGILQDEVYKTCMTDLDDLKHRITTEWTKLDHVVIAASVHQWRRRLSGCVKAGGSHFEHCFDLDIVFSAITTTFLTVVDQSNTYTQIVRPVCLIAVVSCDFALCNTWPLSNSQGKIATLIG